MAGSTNFNPGPITFPTPLPLPLPSDINVINGTEGDDKGRTALKGTALKDQINGFGGNDELTGFGGDDNLRGGDGNDTLDGGPDGQSNGEFGHNILRGGNGSDTYFVHSLNDIIFETSDAFTDTVISDAVQYKLPDTPVEQLIVRSNGRGEVMTGQGNKFDNFIAAQGGKELGTPQFELYGFAGNDTIQGDSTVSNRIFGGAGNDTISVFAGGGDSFISGVDEIGTGSNIGLNEIDTIDVGFNDPRDVTVQLGDSRGVYYQGTNDFARIQNFFAIGDKVVLTGSKQDYSINVGPNGSDFNASLSYKSPTTGIENTVAVFENIEARFVGPHTLAFAVELGNDILNSAQFTPIDQPVKLGSNSNNVIQGTNANGILDGRGGDDKLFAKGGRDIVVGGTGNDMVDGGKGDDLLWGGKGKGTDWLIGGQGADTFVIGKNNISWIKGFQAGVDRIGFMGDVASADLSFVAAKGGGTIIKAGNEKLAFLQGVNSNQVTLNDVVQTGMTQLSGMSVPTILG